MSVDLLDQVDDELRYERRLQWVQRLWKPVAVCLILLLVLVMAVQWYEAKRTERAMVLTLRLAEAAKFLDHQKADEALALLDGFPSGDRGIEASAWVLRGEAHRQKQQWSDAVAAYESAFAARDRSGAQGFLVGMAAVAACQLRWQAVPSETASSLDGCFDRAVQGADPLVVAVGRSHQMMLAWEAKDSVRYAMRLGELRALAERHASVKERYGSLLAVADVGASLEAGASINEKTTKE
jgi:hypothetical protein